MVTNIQPVIKYLQISKKRERKEQKQWKKWCYSNLRTLT